LKDSSLVQLEKFKNKRHVSICFSLSMKDFGDILVD